MSLENKPSSPDAPQKDTPNGNRPASSGEDMLRLVFMLMICMPAFFFARSPHPTPAALAFRIGLIAIGLVGFIALELRKRQRK